jgi:hypothetical protein
METLQFSSIRIGNEQMLSLRTVGAKKLNRPQFKHNDSTKSSYSGEMNDKSLIRSRAAVSADKVQLK